MINKIKKIWLKWLMPFDYEQFVIYNITEDKEYKCKGVYEIYMDINNAKLNHKYFISFDSNNTDIENNITINVP